VSLRLRDAAIGAWILLGLLTWRRVLCWPCLFGGVGLLLWGATSAAADGGVSAESPVYWLDVGKSAVGLVVLLVGGWLAWLDSQVRKNSENVLQNYLTKAETRQLFDDLLAPVQGEVHHTNQAVNAIHRRLDKMKVPAASAEE